jgi:hypothetical protein
LCRRGGEQQPLHHNIDMDMSHFGQVNKKIGNKKQKNKQIGNMKNLRN